jgi:hypothetical protein
VAFLCRQDQRSPLTIIILHVQRGTRSDQRICNLYIFVFNRIHQIENTLTFRRIAFQENTLGVQQGNAIMLDVIVARNAVNQG